MSKKLFFLSLIVIFGLQINAQVKYIGVFGGGAYFSKISTLPSPDLGFIYSDYLDKHLSVRLQGDMASVKTETNSNVFWDLKGMLEYNFFRITNTRHYGKKYTPYLATGLGIADLPETTPGYNLIVPATAGIKFKLGQAASLGIEGSFIYANTNFLAGQNRQTTIDWFAIAGAYLAFNFYKPDRPCPAYR